MRSHDVIKRRPAAHANGSVLNHANATSHLAPSFCRLILKMGRFLPVIYGGLVGRLFPRAREEGGKLTRTKPRLNTHARTPPVRLRKTQKVEPAGLRPTEAASPSIPDEVTRAGTHARVFQNDGSRAFLPLKT